MPIESPPYSTHVTHTFEIDGETFTIYPVRTGQIRFRHESIDRVLIANLEAGGWAVNGASRTEMLDAWTDGADLADKIEAYFNEHGQPVAPAGLESRTLTKPIVDALGLTDDDWAPEELAEEVKRLYSRLETEARQRAQFQQHVADAVGIADYDPSKHDPVASVRQLKHAHGECQKSYIECLIELGWDWENHPVNLIPSGIRQLKHAAAEFRNAVTTALGCTRDAGDELIGMTLRELARSDRTSSAAKSEIASNHRAYMSDLRQGKSSAELNQIYDAHGVDRGDSESLHLAIAATRFGPKVTAWVWPKYRPEPPKSAKVDAFDQPSPSMEQSITKRMQATTEPTKPEWAATLVKREGVLVAMLSRGNIDLIWEPEQNFRGRQDEPVDLSKAPRLAAFLAEMNGHYPDTSFGPPDRLSEMADRKAEEWRHGIKPDLLFSTRRRLGELLGLDRDPSSPEILAAVEALVERAGPATREWGVASDSAGHFEGLVSIDPGKGAGVFLTPKDVDWILATTMGKTERASEKLRSLMTTPRAIDDPKRIGEDGPWTGEPGFEGVSAPTGPSTSAQIKAAIDNTLRMDGPVTMTAHGSNEHPVASWTSEPTDITGADGRCEIFIPPESVPAAYVTAAYVTARMFEASDVGIRFSAEATEAIGHIVDERLAELAEQDRMSLANVVTGLDQVTISINGRDKAISRGSLINNELLDYAGACQLAGYPDGATVTYKFPNGWGDILSPHSGLIAVPDGLILNVGHTTNA
jgi:hypothetical protein